MSKILKIVLIVFIILVTLGFLKNSIVRIAIETGVERATGLPLKIKNFDFGLLRTDIRIQGLQLSNPREYQDKVMVDISEIYVNYDLAALLQKKIHLKQLKLHLKELVVVRNKQGSINLNALKPIQNRERTQAKASVKKSSGGNIAMEIDVLELHMEKAAYKDYSKGETPFVREFNLDINERFEHIQDLHSLVRLLIVKSLANTSIATLSNLDIADLRGTVKDVLGSSTKIASDAALVFAANQTIGERTESAYQAVHTAEDAVRQSSGEAFKIADTAQETAKKTAEALKEKTQSLTKLLPFKRSE